MNASIDDFLRWIGELWVENRLLRMQIAKQVKVESADKDTAGERRTGNE